MFKNKKANIIMALFAIVAVVIAYRIYSNVQADRARAQRGLGARAVAVVTDVPKRQDIVPKLSFSGTLDPEWQADVAAKIDGRIQKVYVKEGDAVQKGQVLAVLEQVDVEANLLNAQGTYLDAQTSLRKAESDLERYEKLYASGAISEKTLEDYRFARDTSNAKLAAASGALAAQQSKADAAVLVAPADGIVAKRYYQEGYYAKAGTAIFAIADIGTLKTVVHIPEGQVAGVRVGNIAQISVPAYPERKLEGKITRIAPVAELPSHTFATEISVDNSAGMLAGIYANVNLKAEVKHNILTIPVFAVVMRDDQQTVFVADKDGVVQRRVLTIGYMDDKVAEVLSGLQEGEVIVTEGHNKLREGSKIKK